MADDADRAEATAAAWLDAAIAAARPTGAGTLECEDCEQPIPAGRRRAMPTATRCVRCQDAHERSAP